MDGDSKRSGMTTSVPWHRIRKPGAEQIPFCETERTDITRIYQNNNQTSHQELISPKEEIMDFPDELKYTEEHEWVAIEEDVATIGISDFAQSQLGDVVFVELPEVVEINEELPDAPEILNTSPYEDGWLIKIRLSNPQELDDLLDATAYQELVADE